MSTKISKTSLTKSFRGKSFSKSIKDPLKKEFGAKSDTELKRKAASFLGGKTEAERNKEYKRIGLKMSSRKDLEGIISPQEETTERKPTLMEKRAMKAKEEMTENRNRARSRSARDELSGGGAMRVESRRSFGSGMSVTTESMVGGGKDIDTNTGMASNLSKKSTFAGAKNNINNKISPSKGIGGPPSRPLGF